MANLAKRSWVPEMCETYIQQVAVAASGTSDDVAARLDALVEQNSQIHDRTCINLNPATNVTNPKAERMLSQGLGSRLAGISR